MKNNYDYNLGFLNGIDTTFKIIELNNKAQEEKRKIIENLSELKKDNGFYKYVVERIEEEINKDLGEIDWEKVDRYFLLLH